MLSTCVCDLLRVIIARGLIRTPMVGWGGGRGRMGDEILSYTCMPYHDGGRSSVP